MPKDRSSGRPALSGTSPGDALPDPHRDVVRFLAWLKKRGRVRHVADCRRKCGQLGLGLEAVLSDLGPEFLRMYRTGGGGRVVMIMDLPWADNCMERHGLEVPHHGQPLRHRGGREQ
jgi:hypothetical protein